MSRKIDYKNISLSAWLIIRATKLCPLPRLSVEAIYISFIPPSLLPDCARKNMDQQGNDSRQWRLSVVENRTKLSSVPHQVIA